MHQGDLHSGESLWLSDGQLPIVFERLSGDSSGETIIIGGGITGALVSLALSQAGMDTILLDKGEIGTGSTAASTGLLQYELDVPLVDLIAIRGERDAVHAYRRGLRAIDELEEQIGTADASCDFSRCETLYLASNEAGGEDVRREYDCRRHFGFDVQFLNRTALRDYCGLDAPAALRSAGDGQVNPYRLTHALLQRALANGLRAYRHTEVSGLEESNHGITLHTSGGRVRCQHAVLCTGYWGHAFLSARAATLNSTFAVASEPLPSWGAWPERTLLWETARPYFYARQTNDRRVIVGGEDSAFAGDHFDAEFLAEKARRLTHRFRQMFPDLPFTPAHVWGGTFGESADGLPFIGPPPGKRHVYVVLGYGGNGITFSVIAARLIADLILRRPNDDQGVFGFGRSSRAE